MWSRAVAGAVGKVTGDTMNGTFSLPEYPYTEYYQPPKHKWIDTGMRKAYCKKCDAEGYWDNGIVKQTVPTNCKDNYYSEYYWGGTD